jgi:hypothetical protein
VAIACTTPNNTIFYTLDGTNPNLGSVVYANPISISQDTTVRAMCVANGFANSDVGSASYTITIKPGDAPNIQTTPNSGQYNNPVAVGLATINPPANTPFTICYTIDGSAPSCNAGVCTGTSATYSAGSPIPVDAPTGGGNLVVNAIACATGFNNGAKATSTYSFKAANPTALPTAPKEVPYNSTVTYATTTTPTGANPVSLKYNRLSDGNAPTDPTCVVADQTIAANAGAVTVQQDTKYKVIACRQNYIPSDVVEFDYTVKILAPTWSPNTPLNGTYPIAQGHPAAGPEYPDTAGTTATAIGNVTAPTLSDPAAGTPAAGAAIPPAPADGFICYRAGGAAGCLADGSDCDANSTKTPVAVTTNTKNSVNAVACRKSYTQSDQLTGVFTLRAGPVAIDTESGKISGLDVDGKPLHELNDTNFWDNGLGHHFYLSTSTQGAGTIINWSTDNTDPTCAATQPATVTTTDVSLPGAHADVNLSALAASFLTIKAIACKPGYQDSPERTLKFADPALTVTLDPLNPASGLYHQTFTVSANAHPNIKDDKSASNPTVCYTWTNDGTDPATPACDPSAQLGHECAHAAGDPNTPGDPDSSNVAPKVTVDGTKVWAVACKSGIPGVSDPDKNQYFLKVGTPTFSATGALAYGTFIDMNTITCIGTGCDLYTGSAAPPVPSADVVMHYTTGNPVAPDPSCVSGTVIDNTSTDPTNDMGWAFPWDTNNGAPSAQIKVIACRNGGGIDFQQSDIAQATFTASLGAPVFHAWDGATSVLVTTTAYTGNNTVPVDMIVPHVTDPGVATLNGTVCYTTDKSVPSCAPGGGGCAPGSTPIVSGTSNGNGKGESGDTPFNFDATQIRAISCATGYPSSGESDLTLTLKADMPVIPSPPTGGQATQIASLDILNGKTDFGKVCYSVDGTEIPLTCDNTGLASVKCVGTMKVGDVGPNDTIVTLGPYGSNVTIKARTCRVSPTGGSFQPSDELIAPFTFGPYSHDILVDGGFTDWIPAQNTLYTDGACPGGGCFSQAFISWNATDIFVGFQGTSMDTTANNIYFDFYVRAGTGATTLTYDSIPAGTVFGTKNNVAPAASGYTHHFFVKSDGTSVGERVWGGAQWGDTTAVNWSHQLGTNSIEVRVSRADLGLSGNASLVLTGFVHTAGAMTETFPDSSDLDGPFTGTYYNANMGSALFPNTPAYTVTVP